MNEYKIYEEIKRFIQTLDISNDTYEKLIQAITEALNI